MATSLLDDRGPPFDQTPSLLPELDVRPSFGEEERGHLGVQPRFAFIFSLRDAYISGNDYPVALAGK